MDTNDEIKAIPEPTMRRLPTYHHFLKGLAEEGGEVVSCSVIGAELGLDPTQVRKDLALTGITGKPKVGYDLADLIEAIESLIGWNDVRQTFLVGVGHLGTALLGYQQFNQYGLEIVAAFDADPSKVGTEVHGRPVMPVSKLADLARRMHVMMGIITVPPDEAQFVADQMVAGGIKAIWNFAPKAIAVPEGVIVENEDLFSSVAMLSCRLATKLKGNEKK